MQDTSEYNITLNSTTGAISFWGPIQEWAFEGSIRDDVYFYIAKIYIKFNGNPFIVPSSYSTEKDFLSKINSPKIFSRRDGDGNNVMATDNTNNKNPYLWYKVNISFSTKTDGSNTAEWVSIEFQNPPSDYGILQYDESNEYVCNLYKDIAKIYETKNNVGLLLFNKDKEQINNFIADVRVDFADTNGRSYVTGQDGIIAMKDFSINNVKFI